MLFLHFALIALGTALGIRVVPLADNSNDKCPASIPSITMLAAEHYLDPFADVALPNHLFEIHRSKISLHHAKSCYDYPSIRLPHTLTKCRMLDEDLSDRAQRSACFSGGCCTYGHIKK